MKLATFMQQKSTIMYQSLRFLIVGCFIQTVCLGQQSSDSTAVANTLKQLLSICKNVDFSDPKTLAEGTFYKAAPFIVYRGDDKKRAWKDIANYSDAKEKIGVDEVCYKINNTVNQDSSYQIISYRKETESEGTWHVLELSYKRKGVFKKTAFAFLNIKGRFALGDID